MGACEGLNWQCQRQVSLQGVLQPGTSPVPSTRLTPSCPLGHNSNIIFFLLLGGGCSSHHLPSASSSSLFSSWECDSLHSVCPPPQVPLLEGRDCRDPAHSCVSGTQVVRSSGQVPVPPGGRSGDCIGRQGWRPLRSSRQEMRQRLQGGPHGRQVHPGRSDRGAGGCSS